MQDAVGVERQQSGPIPSSSCGRKMASRQHLDDHHLQVGDREMGRNSGGLWKKVKTAIRLDFWDKNIDYFIFLVIYAHMLAYVRFFLYLCRLKYFTYD